MKKQLPVALSGLILLCGCTTQPTPTEGYTFTDAAGVQITLPEKLERVAVLFSSYADVWQLAGGAVSVTVGESVTRGICPEGTPLVDDGAGKTIDMEALLSYEPDFVICSATLEGQISAAEILNENGIPCARFSIESFDDFYRMLAICTDITGDKQALETYGDRQRERISSILSETHSEESVLFIRSASSRKSTKTLSSSDNFAASMLSEFGLNNIADGCAILAESLNVEYILTQDPTYIFFTVMGDETAGKNNMYSMLEEDIWSELTAVKEGRVFYLPKSTFQYKPTDGWADAYAFLAEKINGEKIR
ncbi:MAG: ABC transporter substrate-binding protein [Clostridia bacterium]|nr:ABC transporter substrate-binding protein [Clostridia bacterium]